MIKINSFLKNAQCDILMLLVIFYSNRMHVFALISDVGYFFNRILKAI
jgi:hypothetical protein